MAVVLSGMARLERYTVALRQLLDTAASAQRQ